MANSIVIRDLIWNMNTLADIPLPKFDMLREQDGLFEATLLDIYYMPLMNSLLLLFDFRTSINADLSDNTGILICKKVVDFNISNEKEGHKIWMIGISNITISKNGMLQVNLTGMFHHKIEIESQDIILLSGYVDGIGDVGASIEMDNLTPFLDTIPSLDSQIIIHSKSNLSVSVNFRDS